MFAIRSVINDRRKAFRVAIVVSKKVSKSAVVRNRIRRRLYELVRQQSVGILQPYDIVITVFNAGVADIPAQDLKNHVEQLFTQAALLTPNATGVGRGIIHKKEL